MKIVDKNEPIYNRRILLVDALENHPEYNMAKSEIPLLALKNRQGLDSDGSKKTLLMWQEKEFSQKMIIKIINTPVDEKKMQYLSYLVAGIDYLVAGIDYSEHSNIAFAPIDYSYANFRFPPQHPQKGIVYSCTDFDPNYYIPLSTFHQYSFDLKQSSFIKMCAHLGAKEIFLINEEIDNVVTNLNMEVEVMVASASLNTRAEKNEFKSNITHFLFPKPSHKQTIPFQSKWIETEPTWETLQEVRLENNASSYNCELNYTDEMGVTADLAARYLKNGLNIGGTFEKIKKIKRNYKVIFWE